MEKVKVKIIFIDDDYCEDHYPYDSSVIQGSTDWLEISKEDLDTLIIYKSTLKYRYRPYANLTPVVVVESIESSHDIQELLKIANEEKVKHEAREKKHLKAQAEAKAKKDAAKVKREQAKKQLTEDQEKILLEELKKRYEK